MKPIKALQAFGLPPCPHCLQSVLWWGRRFRLPDFCHGLLTIVILLVLLAAFTLQAQTFPPLHVSPAGFILDNTGKPVILRGLNRSGTGSGNAEATSTDAEYASQNNLLSMNVVRLFVNATWWTNNVMVPIAAQPYQTYIDGLIQRAEKYGNYVVVLKAGNFPDAPCGASGTNCPAPNQGDINCAANAALCAAQDTTGNNIDAAFAFWDAFSQKYASDPAVLYDTWEDMHGIDNGTWSNGQNQLIGAIRTNNPQALIFVEDTGTAFEAIVAGTLPDLSWSNLAWNFHLYAGPAGTCTETASPRIANWPKNIDPLVAYAQAQGHAVAITEWGGCNDSDPYHTNITTYAQAHSIALVYFDSTYLLTPSGSNFQLTATGTKVAASYKSIAAGGPGVVTSVTSTDGRSTLAPESIASAFGANLAPSMQQAQSIPLPTVLGGTTVLVTDANGIARYGDLFYVSPTQVNYEVPPGVAPGKASVTVAVNGDPVAFGTITLAAVAPGIYTADSTGKGVAAGFAYTLHPDGTNSLATIVQCNAGGVCTAVPIDMGAATDQVTLELFGTGIRGHTGTVSAKVGTATATVAYAGPQNIFVGLDQVNITLPRSLIGAGAVTVALTVDTQAANPVTVTFK
jgi:uncharacterized protein (TIGR03437 family)